jgi:hypothetical protein
VHTAEGNPPASPSAREPSLSGRTLQVARVSALSLSAGLLTLLPLVMISSQKVVPAFAMPVIAIVLVFASQSVWPARIARTLAVMLLLVFFSASITSVGLLFVPGLVAMIGSAVDAWRFPRAGARMTA